MIYKRKFQTNLCFENIDKNEKKIKKTKSQRHSTANWPIVVSLDKRKIGVSISLQLNFFQ